MAGRTVTDGGVRIVCGSRQVFSGLRGHGHDRKEVKGLAEPGGIPVNTFLWALPDITLNRVKICGATVQCAWGQRVGICDIPAAAHKMFKQLKAEEETCRRYMMISGQHTEKDAEKAGGGGTGSIPAR